MIRRSSRRYRKQQATGYNPSRAPDPTTWLALDESTAIDMVLEYHRRARIHLPNIHAHAALQTTVENQIALGDELPVRSTLSRLMADGLTPHEAVHAIATVLIVFLSDLKEERVKGFTDVEYAHRLDELTVESWLALAEPDPGKS